MSQLTHEELGTDVYSMVTFISAEIFRTNSTRITKRTSSACWEGTDALTADDLERYNRAMGFTAHTMRASRLSSTSFGGNAR